MGAPFGSSIAVLCALVGGTLSVSAQDEAVAEEDAAPVQISCADLAAVPFSGFTITSTFLGTATEARPQRCLVKAEIPPEQSETGESIGRPILFEALLPEEWSGRSVHFGFQGYGTEIPALTGADWQTPNAAEVFPFKAHALYGGDSGHRADDLPSPEDPASFASDPGMLADFAEGATAKVHAAAQTLIETRYGTPAELRYFVGFGDGGRQGLMAAQRRPEDYDGILAGEPIVDFTGLMLLRERAAHLFDDPRAYIPPEMLDIVKEEIRVQCDWLDGVSDGVIADWEGCAPDLAIIACAESESDRCLTFGQIEALNALHAPMSTDLTVHAGLPWGTSDWDTRYMGTPDIPPTARDRVADFRDWFVTPPIAPAPTPEDEVAEDDTDQEIVLVAPSPAPDADARIAELEQMLDAEDPDLGAFAAAGGHLTVYAGSLSEYPPGEMADLWRRMVRDLGRERVDSFVRFYVFPGVTHDRDVPEGMPAAADLFAALEVWVEFEGVPEGLVNSSPDGSATAERPLCPYPLVPRYDGEGPHAEAASFACAE
ncbi:tannase/feruloyl esterase family alpha/beta hydrolase [Pelagovum pacificum]|uniref:tannase/feruloyl esterase family alpha/beta hydrolase n=1 Tax=Pelagovum pacificum TaxID=2588711 RepID=UPI0018CD2CE3|nr:tannase/feruloyl esterase family alpha/beta hydrolase [Pelagovum pacificum]QQA43286.1 tannase/feruloyl esterase family alpha/beta hydrolase [Pelagovum pacificum]